MLFITFSMFTTAAIITYQTKNQLEKINGGGAND